MLETEVQVSLLLRFALLCTVTKHNRGRITLKAGLGDLPALASLLKEVPDLEAEIRRIPGYKKHELRVGLLGGSVVIDYDPVVFPPDLWDDLAGLKLSPERKELVTRRLYALFDGKSVDA